MIRIRWALVVFPVLAWQCQAQTFTNIFTFEGSPIGEYPEATLLQGPNGVLYGTTCCGNLYGNGGVFSLTPPSVVGQPWVGTSLFAASLGATQPVLVAGSGGVLYGVISSGGSDNYAFSLTPPVKGSNSWTEENIAFFDGVNSQPNSLVPEPGGVVYGTTFESGPNSAGTFFKLTPPATAGGLWTQTVLYNFPAPTGYPNSLINGPGGSFYGTCGEFILSNTNGCVFQLVPPAEEGGSWTEVVLYAFTGTPDGSSPSGPPVLSSAGVLYGTTASGGVNNGGTAWSLTPPAEPNGAWVEAVLHSFTGPIFGPGNPREASGSIVLGVDGAIFGTTQEGGSGGEGTVYRLAPPSEAGQPWIQTILYSFSNEGQDPYSGLTLGRSGKVLYGTASTGGSGYVSGTVFEIAP